MQQISSRLTLFHKFILPLWFVLGLIDVLFGWSGTLYADPNMPVTVLPYILLGFCIWSFWLGWPLKKVSIVGDKLYVSNFRKEIAVPITEIVNVRGNILTDPQRVTIYLRNETEFGSKIIFIAKYRWFASWSKHPIVNELLEIARSQHQTGFLTRPTQ